jgi:hypothetical protein
MVKYYYSGDVVYSTGGGNSSPVRVFHPARKLYKIGDKERILIISAVSKLAAERVNKLVFLTITFPFDPTEREASTLFVKFMDNFKKTYKNENYVWVKEFQKNGRAHYHLVCDIPFFSIIKAQRTWNKIIKGMFPHIVCGNNSLRLPDKCKWRSVIDNPVAVARYIAKYVTKSASKSTDGYFFRAYQVSKGLFPIVTELGVIEFIDLLRNGRIIKRSSNKYCYKGFLKNR